MLTEDYIALILVYAIIGCSLAIAMVAEKRTSLDSRKIIHIGVGSFVFVWWMFSEQWIMLVFFTIPFAVLLFLAMMKDNAVAKSKLGELSQEKGHKTGLFLYAITITIMVLFFFGDHWTAASVGIMAMTWGDGMGSVIGRRYGKHKILNGKSLEGSLGVFLATFIMSAVIILFYAYLASIGQFPAGEYTAILPIWAVCAIAGGLAAVLEAVSPGEIDNLVIPIVIATVMAFLGL
jgi:phytol kinase